MDKIDFSKIVAQSSREYKVRAIESELQRVGRQNVCLSDCLVNQDREGLFVMRMLHEHHKQFHDLFYKIKVLKDLWGKPVKPGDKVEWKAGRRVRDAFGNKYTLQQIKDYERRGELRQIEIWHNATVDEKGCISVGFEDAAILLSERGVHYESGVPITGMKETSKETIHPHTGKALKPVQHYWLYSECPKEIYESLPVISSPKKSDK
jgi:hypothetical protein